MAASSRRAHHCPGCAKPVRDRASATCNYCGMNLVQQDLRCATCDGKAPSTRGRCPHCGTPDVFQRSANSRVAACDRCGARTATDATACLRCGAPPPLALAVGRPPEDPAAQLRLGAVTLAAPLADLEVVKGRQAQRLAPELLERAGAATGPTVTCPACMALIPATTVRCPRCDFDRSVRVAGDATAHVANRAVMPVKIAVTAALCLGLLAAQFALLRRDDHQADGQRILASLGPGASQSDVAELRQRAAALGVQAETLATLKRICFLRPHLALSEGEIQAIVLSAPPESRDAALIQRGRTQCGSTP